MAITAFSPAVIEALGYYVYLLIDPDTDEIFYIGKGTGNRIFAHLNEAVSQDTETVKLDRIRAIHARGKVVRHIIQRHGLTEKEAFEVEAALIDFVGLTDLTNRVLGHHSHDRGAMTITEVVAAYDAPQVLITEPVILVIINRLYQRGMSADDLYEVTCGNWHIGKRRNKADYVFAVSNSLIRQVYRGQRWFPVQARNATAKIQTRWRFDGQIAPEMQHYVGGSVANYITLGAQNPIKYVNC